MVFYFEFLNSTQVLQRRGPRALDLIPAGMVWGLEMFIGILVFRVYRIQGVGLVGLRVLGLSLMFLRGSAFRLQAFGGMFCCLQ